MAELSVYKVGAGLARSLPRPVLAGAGRVLGAGGVVASPARRAIVERNLRRVHGPSLDGWRLRRAVQQTFEAYARYYWESARLVDLDTAEINAGFSVEGFGYVEDSHAAGRGTILALPHLGGWEWAGAWLTRVPRYEVTAVAEAIGEDDLADFLSLYRERFGLNIVELGTGAGSAIMRALKANHIVCLLCDRDIGGGGIDVEFFGETTTVPGGPATMALRAGAALLPTAVYHRGRYNHGVVRPPLALDRHGRLRDDVARVSQALTDELEGLIRRAPEQWHVMQPNWPSDHEALAARGLG